MAPATPRRSGSGHPGGDPVSIRQVSISVTRPDERRATNRDRDWLLEVATALQTTLDVETMIRLFGTHSSRVVAHDALRFEDASKGLQIAIGPLPSPDNSVTYDLILADHALGQLSIHRSRPFDPDETLAFENILCNLVHPLRNALLYREALEAAARDPLTGINNRAYLDRVLDREIELARRYGNALAVVLIDADRFKRVNDRYGHLAGDQVLRGLAQTITACMRESDMAFRYGGEEFVLVLSNTELAGGLRLAERIREKVEKTPILLDSEQLRLTISVGVASLISGDDSRKLIGRADQALYRSKESGRNRCTAATEGNPAPSRSPGAH